MKRATVAALALALLGASGFAGAGTLVTDTNAMSGWKGSALFDTAATYGTTYFTATVDYAVYEPGQFELSFPGVSVQPDEYVYAYQVVDVADGVMGSGTGFVSRFTVLLDEDELLGTIDAISGSGSIAPSSIAFAPVGGPYDTAGWSFASPNEIDSGLTGEIVFYASSDAPEMGNAAVTGSYGFGDNQTLPNPIPEPATMLVLVGGTAALVARRAARKAN